jgi:hypothetical protein
VRQQQRVSWCKVCYKAHHKEYLKRPGVRERYRENGRRADRKRAPKRYADPVARAKRQQYSRQHYLNRKYRLTPEAVERMAAAQCHRCAACGDKAELHIDHCHGTGLIRGLLCRRCNITLGYMQDDVQRITNLACYLIERRNLTGE